MTERLYETDSYCRRFTATVTACLPHGEDFAVILDRTAFFPEGGGQAADTGTFGGIPVTDVQMTADGISHYTTAPLTVGDTVEGEIDWATRFSRMQHHTAEHIICGLAHRDYGYENVGFHLGHEDVTLDLSGELTRAQLDALEEEANAIVAANVAVTAIIPPAEELDYISYRSKKEKILTGPVRLVTVEGVDCCACCAPHVSRTGEIGLIKLLDFLRWKGGVRIHLLCGRAALTDYRTRYTQIADAAAKLSVKQHDFTAAFDRLLAERDSLRLALREANRRLADKEAEAVLPTDRPVCLFGADWDGEVLQRLVNTLTAKCTGYCAAYAGADGDYRYVVGGGDALPAVGKRMNETLNGRGGGNALRIQGRVQATRAEIEAFWEEFAAAK